MMPIKLFGACMIALSGWLCGLLLAFQTKKHRMCLQATIALLKTIEEEISFRRTNLNDIYKAVQENQLFPPLETCFLQAGQVAEQSNHFQNLLPPNTFTNEERSTFSDCFKYLGHTGAVQECKRLARYRKQFEAFYQTSLEAEHTAFALDQKIGFALGCMVALILI